MTQLAIHGTASPLSLELGSALQLGDDELFELCRRNPELRIERSPRGDLLVMTPVGGESSQRNAELIFALMEWAKRDGSGIVFDSSGGFLLPNGAMRSPDAAWVERSRWAALSDDERSRFIPLAPDLVVELRSPSDPLHDLQRKMEEYRDAGVRLGWLIDPTERRVYVYRPDRPDREPEILDAPDSLSAEPELPGFVLDLLPIWQPG